MEDFNSETDSDYTSYWRDWVGARFDSFVRILTTSLSYLHLSCCLHRVEMMNTARSPTWRVGTSLKPHLDVSVSSRVHWSSTSLHRHNAHHKGYGREPEKNN